MEYGVSMSSRGQRINAFTSRDQAQSIMGFKAIMSQRGSGNIPIETFDRATIVMPKMEVKTRTDEPKMWNWDHTIMHPVKKEASIYNPLRGSVH